tara:strand:+ start:145 stop:453 length:309 start_codon:yes stop_codon:yes gene_type:complete
MSTQQNPTLIPGFEDIIRHIKQQEDQIKKLKEKDKEWKASHKHLNKCIDTIRDQYLEQKEENKKLKEEIIRLEEEGVFMDDYGGLTAEEEEEEAEEFLKQSR